MTLADVSGLGVDDQELPIASADGDQIQRWVILELSGSTNAASENLETVHPTYITRTEVEISEAAAAGRRETSRGESRTHPCSSWSMYSLSRF